MQFDRLLAGLSSGVQLFSMLLANRRLLDLLAEIAGCAPRLSGYLGRNPAVLDTLIDPDFLARLPSQAELRAQFAMAVRSPQGYETALDSARRFAKEEIFRIGARLIFGSGPAADAGPAFSALAGVLISGLQDMVETDFARIHGRVPGGELAVVALGKLGGCEMTATSDLDLVFIYAHDESATQSTGEKPLPVSTWFGRLAQRFIAALTAQTAEGRLFEVDMRLRPSGSQGPVAVTLERFIAYHREHSWTWELMALTRARVIAGPKRLKERIAAAIPELLLRRRDEDRIRADAAAMRQKLSAQFPGGSRWDLKFAPGGLVDIEFVVQILQLSHAQPEGLNQNTIAAAEKLMRAGVLDSADGKSLIAAARLQQDLTQVLRVAIEGELRPERATPGLKSLLARVGGVTDFARLEEILREHQKAAHEVLGRVLSPRQHFTSGN